MGTAAADDEIKQFACWIEDVNEITYDVDFTLSQGWRELHDILFVVYLPANEEEYEEDYGVPSTPTVIVTRPNNTPPTATVDVSLSTSGTSLNYKTLRGTLRGSASSSAKITKNDGAGTIANHTIEIGINNFNTSKTYSESQLGASRSTTSSSNSTSMSLSVGPDDIGSILLGTAGTSTRYKYSMGAFGLLELTDTVPDPISGTQVPISTSDGDGGVSYVTLSNTTPTTSMSDITSEITHYYTREGERVELNPTIKNQPYLYEEVPVTFSFDFSDSENDLAYNEIAIGKGSTVGANAVLIVSNGINTNTGANKTSVTTGTYNNRLYDLDIESNSLDEFLATLKFYEPGTYWYQAYCEDAKSMLSLSRTSNVKKGTFTIINGAPQEPTADVTEPIYSYAEEYIDFKQASTDPNGIDDIVQYDYTFPSNAKVKYKTSTPKGKNGGQVWFAEPQEGSNKTYPITLKVTDRIGLFGEDTLDVQIIDSVPIPDIDIVGGEPTPPDPDPDNPDPDNPDPDNPDNPPSGGEDPDPDNPDNPPSGGEDPDNPDTPPCGNPDCPNPDCDNPDCPCGKDPDNPSNPDDPDNPDCDTPGCCNPDNPNNPDKNQNNKGTVYLKENRKVVISAKNSLFPKKYPILWNECIWEVKPMGGGAKNQYVSWDDKDTNNNKQRVLQFSKAGKYRVYVTLVNAYSKANPDSEDIGATKAYVDIIVYKDKTPKISVDVTSNKPNFVDNPVSCDTVFTMTASTTDDIINLPDNVTWTVYEDLNNDGKFTSNEVLPSTDYKLDSKNKTVSITTRFQTGSHNFIKAQAEVIETFKEPYVQKLLPSDGSWKRTATDFKTYVVNWVPVLELIPEQGPSTIPTTQFNPNPGTPYEDIDINGDGIIDGKFIRAYTDDTFSLKTKITDELPQIADIEWELEKLNHSGTYDKTDSLGREWIRSRRVSNNLGHDGGTLRIDEPGIYRLTSTVIDDCGETDTAQVHIRVYTLPKAVLTSNPKYTQGGPYVTKENIRFDIKSSDSVVDDEWGVAWHKMDWSKDNWDIIPSEIENVQEIHVMNPEYTARYNDAIAGDSLFSGRNSQIGFNSSEKYRSISFTEPGTYDFKYWGTNYGNKVTTPFIRKITVIEDLPPIIEGNVINKYYRDPSDSNRATIALLGPYSPVIGRQALTLRSLDDDYIDFAKITITYDANNNKMFDDTIDIKWYLEENGTNYNGMEYIFERIDNE